MAGPHRATSSDDPRLADFVALNDPAQRREVERRGGYFVVEGLLALERLLATPGWSIRSIAVTPRAHDRLAGALGGGNLPVVVAEPAVLRTVVGFDLHRGVLASVERRPLPPASELVAPGRPGLFVATEGVNDHENLGAIYRNAAAFGAAGVLVDPSTADPFYRRCVRVSLGHVLAVPTARLDGLPASLGDLRRSGARTVALVPRGGRALADLRRSDLDASGVDAPGSPGPLVLVVGAEGPGLRADTIAAADLQVSIPMASDVDSLNVATAAAVALHHLRSVVGVGS